jgi:hypothetical protein
MNASILGEYGMVIDVKEGLLIMGRNVRLPPFRTCLELKTAKR